MLKQFLIRELSNNQFYTCSPMCLEICLHMFSEDSPFKIRLISISFEKYFCSLNLFKAICNTTWISYFVNQKIRNTHAVSLLLMQKVKGGEFYYLIPCGGSLVYLRDIWRRPIGKFLFTSVVIHSLVFLTRINTNKNPT